ncbi:helix-turn-helix domain-containing protein [Scytonema sp. NUACC26]|uniref:helix-turn-helix domain-containing protein n=1 Tax=Scytonema sp. NUACC26 TaxID=3140176 RepID=UPI0034DBDD2C
MDLEKRKRLEAAGWTVGTVEDFLELSPVESELVELKLTLSRYLKRFRSSQQISQETLAKRMNSSQSRVAKMEAGDPSVSVDLLVRALFYTGATRKDVAEAILCRSEEKN